MTSTALLRWYNVYFSMLMCSMTSTGGIGKDGTLCIWDERAMGAFLGRLFVIYVDFAHTPRSNAQDDGRAFACWN